MPQALDKSGQPIDVAPESFVDSWRKGDIQPVAGQQYHVAFPDGKFYKWKAENLRSAIDAGGRLVGEPELAHHKLDVEYGGVKGGLIAAGGGALEQGTLGLGEHLLPDEARTAIRESEQRHPYAQFAGEAVGMLGLGAATAGAGEALGLGRLAAGGLGGLAERGAASLLGKGAESTLARIGTRSAVQAARAAAEGAQYGAAREIGQSAIDPANHPLTASHILAEVGGDALYAGAFGGVLGAAGGALEGKLSRAFSDARAPAPADIEAAVGKAVHAEPAPGLGKLAKEYTDRIASAVSGAAKEDIEPFTGDWLKEGGVAYENRRAVAEADELRAASSREITEQLNDVVQNRKKLLEESYSSLKRAHINPEGVDASEAAQATRDMVDHTVSELHGILGDPGQFGMQREREMENAITFADRSSKRLDQAILKGDVGEQYGLVDDLKKAIGSYTKGAAKDARSMGGTDRLFSEQLRARSDRLKELYETLREGLEDETLWGKTGAAQKKVNKAITNNLEAAERFNPALTTKVGRDPEDLWEPVYGIDANKSDRYVKNLMNPSQDLTHKAIVDYVQSARDVADNMQEMWQLSPEKMKAAAKLRESADAFQQTLEKTTDNLKLVNSMEAMRNATTGHAMSFLGAAGAIIGGAPGYVIGKTIGKVGELFSRPADAIMQVARIEGMIRRSQGRIGRAARAALRGATKSAEAVPLEQFERRAAKVRDMVADPQALQARVAANTRRLGEISPGLSQALTVTTMTGLQFLASKLPVRPPMDPLNPGAKIPPPPPGQREAWLRYDRAFRDPHTVAEDLQANRVPIEGVEVLKNVYPPLYKEVQETFYNEMADGKGKDMDKQRQIGLALLLDLTTPMLDPLYIRERQAAYLPQPTPQDAPKSKRSRPAHVDTGMTQTQRVESASTGEEKVA